MNGIDLSSSQLKKHTALSVWYSRSLALTLATLLIGCLAHTIASYKLRALKLSALQAQELKSNLEKLKRKRNSLSRPKARAYHNDLYNYMRCLESIIPDHVRLDEITFKAPHKLTLSGTARSSSEFNAFFKRLRHEKCFAATTVQELKRSTINNSSLAQYDQAAVPFTFTVIITLKSEQ
jgi:Tfp pilus assembly protein PilN